MNPRRTALVLLVVTAVLLLSGCHRLGLTKSPAKPKATTTSTSSSPTSSPSTTAKTAGAFTIAVQNGGGIKGRGASMVSRLEGLGFAPSKKATNAKVSTYTTTTVYFSPGHESEAAQVSKALGLGKPQTVPAGVSVGTDVLVIVGTDL